MAFGKAARHAAGVWGGTSQVQTSRDLGGALAEVGEYGAVCAAGACNLQRLLCSAVPFLQRLHPPQEGDLAICCNK